MSYERCRYSENEFQSVKIGDLLFHVYYGVIEVTKKFSQGFEYCCKKDNSITDTINYEGYDEGREVQLIFWCKPEISYPSKPKLKTKREINVEVFIQSSDNNRLMFTNAELIEIIKKHSNNKVYIQAKLIIEVEE